MCRPEDAATCGGVANPRMRGSASRRMRRLEQHNPKWAPAWPRACWGLRVLGRVPRVSSPLRYRLQVAKVAPRHRHPHAGQRPIGPCRSVVALRRWGPTPAAAYTGSAARYPDRAAIDRRARDADVRRGAPAHERARPRDARRGDRRRRRRRDHVPQPPRLHRGDGRLFEARRQRAVPEHGLRRPADHRRDASREPAGADLRRGLRQTSSATAARGASASSPGREPGERSRRSAARGADRRGSTAPS